MILTPILALGQSSNFNIEFTHEWNYQKFFNKQISGKGTSKFAEREPYVHSATIDLTLDLQGKIISVDFIEKNEKEDMNNFFKELVNDTNNLWKPVNVPAGVTTVHVIIPFLYRTAPYSKDDDRPDLIQQFTSYHDGLSQGLNDKYSDGNYIVIPQVYIYSGPWKRGIK